MSKSIEMFDGRKDLPISRAGIRAIFNLESPDEHVHCGHGNHSSGFSYDPAEFMDVGSKINSLCSNSYFRFKVFVYNYAMEDFGTVKVETVLDIMKVMSFAMKQGKVRRCSPLPFDQ